MSGGDIRNAVLKAALAAAIEPGPDADKAIYQRHLDEGIRDVIAGKRVMQQSLTRPPEIAQAEELVNALRTSPVRLEPILIASLILGFTALVVALVALLR